MNSRKPNRHGLGLLCLAACLGLLPSCHLDNASPREEKIVTVKLNDSLSRFSAVRVLILADGDTSQVVGQVWNGPLASPGSIPSYRIEDGETRPLSIRVMGFDAYGRLTLDMRISKDGGMQAITLQQLPKPSPNLAHLQLSTGTLAPPFDPAIKEYSVALANSKDAFTATMTPAYMPAVMLVGATQAFADEPSDSILLQVGVNPITVNVTAADTATQYYLTVTRAAPAGGTTGGGPDTTAKPNPNDAYRRNWAHSALVNTNFSQADLPPSTFVTGFTLLLRLNRTNFNLSQTGPGGCDLRFVTPEGAELPYEISRWAPVLGEADVWIKLDTLRAQGRSNTFLIYWGNATATPASDPAGAFPTKADWTAVWHFEETGTGAPGEFKDATGKFDASGAAAGRLIPARRDAVVGGGQDFNPAATQCALALPAAFDPGPQAWTIQMWVKRMTLDPAVLFSKSDGHAVTNMRVRLSAVNNRGRQLSLWGNGTEVQARTALPALAAYQCLGIVYDGANVSIYMDGSLRESFAFRQGKTATAKTMIGAVDETGATGFHGIMDELWVSSTARSKAYMRLIYENQKPGSTFVTLLPL